MDYIENHQQIKIAKRIVSENDQAGLGNKSVEKKVSKMNKQTYKNLNKTMCTNIMEMDIPLSMKFRNYKTLKPRITIGPSTIHRNGLFPTERYFFIL